MTTDAVPGVADLGEGSAVPEPSPPSNVVRLPNGQTVTLMPELSVPLGMAAATALQQAAGLGLHATEFALVSLWLDVDPFGVPYTIRSWTFTDTKGQIEPINAETIARLLPFEDGGLEVAEAAGRLYGTAVMRPLLKRQGLSLLPLSMAATIPPTSSNGHATRKPSKRSSQASTAGKRRNG